MICGVVFVNTTFLVQRIFMEEYPRRIDSFLKFFLIILFLFLFSAYTPQGFFPGMSMQNTAQSYGRGGPPGQVPYNPYQASQFYSANPHPGHR